MLTPKSAALCQLRKWRGSVGSKSQGWLDARKSGFPPHPLHNIIGPVFRLAVDFERRRRVERAGTSIEYQSWSIQPCTASPDCDEGSGAAVKHDELGSKASPVSAPQGSNSLDTESE